MNKTNSKYWHIFTTVIAAFVLLNSGCLQIKKFSFGNKTKRINILEEKVESLSYNMGSLNTENYELKKNLSELETIRKQLNEEYTQIKNKQITIETAQSSQKEARSRLEGELAETRNLLENIKHQLAMVEKDKNNLKAKLENLEVSSAKTETVAVKTTDTEEQKSDTGKSREGLIKETQEKRKSSLVEDLLDKAIQLYRQEKFRRSNRKMGGSLSA